MGNLQIVYNDNSHKWELNLANAVESCKAFIKERELEDVKINDEITYDKIYDNRTEINNKLKEIQNTRKQACRSITGDFEKSCKELEKLLVEAGQRMTERINEYKPRKTADKKYTLILKTTELKSLEKIKKIAINYGCFEIKQEE